MITSSPTVYHAVDCRLDEKGVSCGGLPLSLSSRLSLHVCFTVHAYTLSRVASTYGSV